MHYDVAMRHQQALDPSALTTMAATLHAIGAAITDCRNAGKDPEIDAAVILLARHLGTVCERRPDDMALRRNCLDQIAEIRRHPVLRTLACRGVAYDEAAKRTFHSEGRIAMRRLAEALGLDWTCDIGAARARVGDKVALQGNMDPSVLFAKPEAIRAEVGRILASFGQGEGHVFNLGHGITPEVDPAHAGAFIESVPELSARYHG